MNELYPEKVRLTKENHVYHHDDGRVFTSLSKVREIVKPSTDFKMIAKMCDAKNGLKAGSTQAEWTKKNVDACDIGTLIHDSLELYGNTAQILPENEWLRPMIISVSAGEKDYYAVYREKTLYDEEYEIAATADRLMATTRSKGSIMDLDDYKTNLSKGITFTCKYKNYLKYPFEHLQNSNYFDYTLQLSTEALFLEKLTGRKIGKMSITYIPPNNPLSWRIIPANYMKFEAIALCNYFKELKHIKANEEPAEKINKEELNLMPNFG